MKYLKPAVTELGTALVAVQSLDKEAGPNTDTKPDTFTTNAYQADE